MSKATASAAGSTLVLLSQEGEKFEVSENVANMSELIKSMIEDGDDDDDDGECRYVLKARW